MTVDLTKRPDADSDARRNSGRKRPTVADVRRGARWARHKIADSATVVADIIGDLIDDLDPWDFT